MSSHWCEEYFFVVHPFLPCLKLQGRGDQNWYVVYKQGHRNSLLTSLSYHIGSKDARDKGIRTSFDINIRPLPTKMSVSHLMFVQIMTSFECQDNAHCALNKMNMYLLIRSICFASRIIDNWIHIGIYNSFK